MYTLPILVLGPLLPALTMALNITSPTAGARVYPTRPWNITWTLPANSTSSNSSGLDPPQINLYLAGPTPATLGTNISSDALFYTVSAGAVFIGGSGVETGFTIKVNTPGDMGNEYVASSDVFTMIETGPGNASASASATVSGTAAATSSAGRADGAGAGQMQNAVAMWLGLSVFGLLWE